MPSSAPCYCLKKKLQHDPQWLTKNLVTPSYNGYSGNVNITYGKPHTPAR